ncbi:MAG: hypothetical protein ACFFCO_06275 [Promethearchaeota archaeon]
MSKPSKQIGLCPKCDNMLTKDDISQIRIKGWPRRCRSVFVCKNCQYIIGLANA